MRFVDRYAGIPVCAGLALLKKISNFLFPKKPNKFAFDDKIKILIIELPEMGSALLAHSALLKLKNHFVNSEIFFLIFKKNKESVDILNLIPESNIITIESSGFTRFCADTIKSIIFFRKTKIDIVIDFEMFSRFSSVYSRLISYKEYAGFYLHNVEGLFRGNLLTKRVNFNYYQHISANYTALIDAVISDCDNKEYLLKQEIKTLTALPKLPEDKENIEKIKEIIKLKYPEFNDKIKIVIICPDAGEIPLRGWSYEKYQSLAKLILEKHCDSMIIITGVKNAFIKNESLKKSVNSERCINFTGETSLYELIQLFHISKILVTNDGGSAHFSALTDIYSFVFFGPETPVLYRPLSDRCISLYKNYNCSPCLNVFNYRYSSCRNNKCVNDFLPEEVYELVKQKFLSAE